MRLVRTWLAALVASTALLGTAAGRIARDGQPLGDDEGPFRLVVPDDKRRGRWVRQLRSLRLVDVR